MTTFKGTMRINDMPALPDNIAKKDNADDEQLICEYEFIDAKNAQKLSIEGRDALFKEVDDFYPKKLEEILNDIKFAAKLGKMTVTTSQYLFTTNKDSQPLKDIQRIYLQAKIINLLRSKSYKVITSSSDSNILIVSWY